MEGLRNIRGVYILVVLACALLTVSCIRDEPLNDECDIESAWLHTDSPHDLFYSVSDTVVNVLYSSSKVVFRVKPDADLSALAPEFKVTEGAVMEPASGSVHDFSTPVTYTVTSQSGRWSRTYSVEFRRESLLAADTISFDFEHYEIVEESYGSFYGWHELDAAGARLDWWASGNPGYGLTGAGNDPDSYPTRVLVEGYDGAALQLTTLSTGSLGSFVGKYIAAGNLFIGSFDVEQTMVNSLKSTRFGIPLAAKPLKLTGYYQYTSGQTYLGPGGKPVEGGTDYGTVYAVFFNNQDENGNQVCLYGDDVQTSPRVVAMARWAEVPQTGVWTPFEIPFEYYSQPDLTDLAENHYSITVVFSSSVGGDTFQGAVGSTLLIDKVSLVCGE